MLERIFIAVDGALLLPPQAREGALVFTILGGLPRYMLCNDLSQSKEESLVDLENDLA